MKLPLSNCLYGCAGVSNCSSGSRLGGVLLNSRELSALSDCCLNNPAHYEEGGQPTCRDVSHSHFSWYIIIRLNKPCFGDLNIASQSDRLTHKVKVIYFPCDQNPAARTITINLSLQIRCLNLPATMKESISSLNRQAICLQHALYDLRPPPLANPVCQRSKHMHLQKKCTEKREHCQASRNYCICPKMG